MVFIEQQTAACCLAGMRLLFLLRPNPTQNTSPTLKKKRNIMRTLDWATLQSIHQIIIVKDPLISQQWSHCIKFKFSQHYFTAWRNPWRVYAATFAATDGPAGAAGVSRMDVHAWMWFLLMLWGCAWGSLNPDPDPTSRNVIVACDKYLEIFTCRRLWEVFSCCHGCRQWQQQREMGEEPFQKKVSTKKTPKETWTLNNGSFSWQRGDLAGS